MRRRWEAEGGEEERGGEGGRHTLATSPIGWPIVDSSQSSMPMTRGSCGWVGCHSMPMSRGSCGWAGCHQRWASRPPRLCNEHVSLPPANAMHRDAIPRLPYNKQVCHQRGLTTIGLLRRVVLAACGATRAEAKPARAHLEAVPARPPYHPACGWKITLSILKSPCTSVAMSGTREARLLSSLATCRGDGGHGGEAR